jgi:alkyldihydroxyacetonephosphate synthase
MFSYRDILKWGDKKERTLDQGMRKLLVELFGFTEKETEQNLYFKKNPVKLETPCSINSEIINEFELICGKENLSFTDMDRAMHSCGKYYGELLKLSLGIIENLPDLVIYPRNSNEVAAIVRICNKLKIPIIAFGGGSSVTGALQAPKGGVCLDLSRNMNRILEINEINNSVTVETGILGPKLENALNNYLDGYTCGHFPQSFEFSTVGGWIAARGAGTHSTGFGKMEDIVLSLRVICPSGNIHTKDYPANAEGIDLNRIFMGSEGIFGIITEACLKIRTYNPKNTKYASFIFKSFESAVKAMRNSMQEGYGKPHLFRISDPSETDIAFRLKGFQNSFQDKLLQTLGYEPGKRVLMFSAIEGSQGYPDFVKKCMKITVRKAGGLYIGSKPTKKWLEQRYSSAYSRDSLMDKGIIADTIETAVNWQNLLSLWKSIVNYLNTRSNTLTMIHISHVYENGANLYITYITPLKKNSELDDYKALHEGLVNTIIENKGSLSHHHGIGRVLSPWMKKVMNETELGVISAIKTNLDPNNIMNPEGMLGLDP